MILPRLTPRLQCIASMIPADARLLDIGCDHALLAISFLLNNPTSSAIGVDNKEKPLAVAAQNRARFCVTDRLRLLQADGIPDTYPAHGDCVVIAGMGGIEIGSILQRAKITKGQFLLSPQSHIDVLRDALRKAELEIKDEIVCLDGNRAYAIIAAQPGPCRTTYTAAERWIGPHLIKQVDTAYKNAPLNLYLNCLEKHLTNMAKGDKSVVEVLTVLERRNKGETDEGR